MFLPSTNVYKSGMNPLPELRKALRRIMIALACFVKQSVPPCVKNFIDKKDKLIQEAKVAWFIARQNLQIKKTPLRTQRYTFASGIGSPSKTIFCD